MRSHGLKTDFAHRIPSGYNQAGMTASKTEQRFKLVAPYEPKGDQPKAIRELTEGIER